MNAAREQRPEVASVAAAGTYWNLGMVAIPGA
jgi:hypothetical protein